MINHKGILGNILAHDGDSDSVGLRSGGQLTRDDIVRLSEQAAEQWRDTFANLLSVFELNGEFGLWSALDAYYRTNALPSSVTDAVAAGDEHGFCRAMYRAQCATFVDLYERRNALSRIQLVEELPAEAMADYARMRQTVALATKRSAATVVQAAPVAPTEVETPIETCVREFREMSGQAWKTKWLNNRNNRPVADQAASDGRLG